jgi:hypothetical protein
MAKTILEELEALVGKEAAAKISASSDIATRLSEGERLYRFYTGDEELEDTTAADKAKADAEKAAAEKAEADRRAAATTTTTSTSAAPVDTNTLLREMGNLLNTRLGEFEKKVITVDKLPQYEGALLTKTLKMAHETMLVTDSHQKEFNEPLDLEKFNNWYEEQSKQGVRYPSISKAHDFYVQDKRIEAKIAAGIAEGVKAKQSSTSVPAQTTSVSLSPAQQVLHDARKSSATEGKSNAVRAAERLAKLAQARESGEAA